MVTMQSAFSELGVPLAPDKVLGPSTSIVYLGIEIDSSAMTIRLPQDKFEELSASLQLWISRSKCTKRELLSLICVLSFACKVVKPGRMFLRRLMLTSAVTLAFFGLFRVSEYTCHSRHQFYSQTTLLFRNVTIAPSLNLVAVRIKCSKTDPFRTGCIIRIGSTGGQSCPVVALLHYSNIHPFPIGPLFIFANGFFLTRSHITNLLRLSLPDVPHINTHSFRIGGATAAASAGIPDSTIQTLGRRSSDAYRRYLRLSDESVQEFCTRMSTVLLFSRF